MPGEIELNSLLSRFIGDPVGDNTRWHRYGMLGNPFPSRAHPIWDVLHNQKSVVDRFLTELGQFARDGNTSTLLFTGGNRVGKTHFMEYHRRVLPEHLGNRGIVLPIAVVSAQSCDIMQFYRQVVDQVDDSIRRWQGSGIFLTAIEPLSQALLQELPPGDFRSAVESYASCSVKERQTKAFLLRDWVRGVRLRSTQRNELKVTGLIESTAQLINACESLVKYLLIWGRVLAGDNQIKHMPGMLVFVDEFELIFTFRRDRRDLFLQGLRALIDACPKGLFLCVGMATGLGVELDDLESQYPALFARLRGADKIPSLLQVGGVLEAIDYAKAFITEGKKKGQQQMQLTSQLELVSDREIEQAFQEVAGAGSAPQGDFFDRLHTIAETNAATGV